MKKYKEHNTTVNFIRDCEVMYETKTHTTSVQADPLDNLTLSQQKSLYLAINQLNEGNYVPHNEVVKMSKQWLKM